MSFIKKWFSVFLNFNDEPNTKFVYQRNGYCPICEKKVNFSSHYTWLRDHYKCSECFSIPRERAIMNVIQSTFPNWRGLSIHESSPVGRGASQKLRMECAKYIATQYDPGIGFGNNNNEAGYQSENLEHQTFKDEMFDIVVTQDVMEHIFDTARAFKEIYRTLRPGGAHIFTTPLVNKERPSVKRAEINKSGEIIYYFPREFHGNPMSENGSLVTWHWGYDIVEYIYNAIGQNPIIIDTSNPEMGIEAEYTEVIMFKK
jgi:SAM-dependent methyltransferase